MRRRRQRAGTGVFEGCWIMALRLSSQQRGEGEENLSTGWNLTPLPLHIIISST